MENETMYIPKYKPPHSGERALDKSLSTLLVYLEDAIRRDEQILLDNRSKPCPHCNSTGKADDTFDKMCDKCTPPHCCRCGTMVGLEQVGSFSLCRTHLAEERWES